MAASGRVFRLGPNNAGSRAAFSNCANPASPARLVKTRSVNS
jgi:hypothetical protein